MRVYIDKAGRDKLARRINLVPPRCLDRADLRHPVAINGNIRRPGRITQAIDHLPTADHDIVVHQASPFIESTDSTGSPVNTQNPRSGATCEWAFRVGSRHAKRMRLP